MGTQEPVLIKCVVCTDSDPASLLRPCQPARGHSDPLTGWKVNFSEWVKREPLGAPVLAPAPQACSSSPRSRACAGAPGRPQVWRRCSARCFCSRCRWARVSSWTQKAAQMGGCRGQLSTQGPASSREPPDKGLPPSRLSHRGGPVLPSRNAPGLGGPQGQGSPPTPAMLLSTHSLPTQEAAEGTERGSKSAASKSEVDGARLRGDRAETESERENEQKQFRDNWGNLITNAVTDGIKVLMLSGVKMTQGLP